MPNKHIDLFKEMIPAVDMGMKELWDAATDEGRKEIKLDMWNLNRYISNVKSTNRELQEHFVIVVNELYNKHYAELSSKHIKLLWLLLCMCSHESKKTYFHEWIKLNRKTEGSSKKARFLMEIYPTMKLDDVELLAKLMTDKEAKALAKEHGYDDKAIKDKL